MGQQHWQPLSQCTSDGWPTGSCKSTSCCSATPAECVAARSPDAKEAVPPTMGRRDDVDPLPGSPLLSEGHEREPGDCSNAAGVLWTEAVEQDVAGLPVAASPRSTPKTLREALELKEFIMHPEAAKPFKVPDYFSSGLAHMDKQPSDPPMPPILAPNQVLWSDGSTYEGELDKAGVAHGLGKQVRPDGSTYLGEWAHGEKSGIGQESWPDGTTYEGEFSKSTRHGHGVFRVKTGMLYEGQFANEQMEGNGTCTFADGRKFSGQWEQGHISGHGMMLWPNGSNYNGQYLGDSKHGKGAFTWPDGKSYRGEWRDGKQHGTGVATDPKGNCSHGKWSKGQLVSATDPKDLKAGTDDFTMGVDKDLKPVKLNHGTDTFVVEVEKFIKGTSFGLVVSRSKNLKNLQELEVKSIGEGVVQDYNKKEEAAFQIKESDRIIEVNGISGNTDKMLDAIEKEDKLSLVVKRPS